VVWCGLVICSRQRKNPPMTPAEFDTRRRYLGLSVDEAAALCGVQDRTIRRWQSGASPIPADAPAALDRLEYAMTNSVASVVRLTTDRMAGGVIELYRYRTPEHQATSPHASGIPLGAHAMLTAWTANELVDEGFDVRVEWAD